MLTFQNLLFPTDLSARCVHFAPYVGGIARKFGSEITLLHTLDMHDPFGYGAASSTTVYGDCEAEVKKLHEKAFAEFGKDAFAGLDMTRITRTGDSAACIIKYAEEHNTDVIFMPYAWPRRFRRLLLGSVTSKVLHDARIPVWTSAHSESADGNAAASRDIRCIICAVDLSPDAVRVVRAAAGLGASYGRPSGSYTQLAPLRRATPAQVMNVSDGFCLISPPINSLLANGRQAPISRLASGTEL